MKVRNGEAGTAEGRGPTQGMDENVGNQEEACQN